MLYNPFIKTTHNCVVFAKSATTLMYTDLPVSICHDGFMLLFAVYFDFHVHAFPQGIEIIGVCSFTKRQLKEATSKFCSYFFCADIENALPSIVQAAYRL